MTGDQEGIPPPPKKSYNIVDILYNKELEESTPEKLTPPPRPQSPSDLNNNHEGSTSNVYNPFPFVYNQSRLLPLLIDGRNISPSSPTVIKNTEEQISPTFSQVEQHHHSQYFFKHQSPLVTSSGLPSSATGDFTGNGTLGLGGGQPLQGTASLFPSPYISLLLANSFVQPYLQHHHQQRFQQEFYTYNGGRPFTVGSKRKGGQVRFAAAQTARLEKEFLDHKYLHANDRKRLAQSLKLTDRQVKTWFQNRRAKWRKVGVLKVHRSGSETHLCSTFGGVKTEDAYSPDQARCVSVSSTASESSS